MPDYWFKPKTNGYGATPVTWQGWVVTMAAVAVIIGLTHFMIIVPQLSGRPPDLATVLIWAALVAATTGALVWITRAKTDGEWKWRWGDKD